MTNDPVESREKVKAARETKKLAKQQAKIKRDAGLDIKQPAKASPGTKKDESSSDLPTEDTKLNSIKEQAKEVKSVVDSSKEIKSKDEVDRAAILDKTESIKEAVLDKDHIKSERAAKKAAKQAKKAGAANNAPVIPKADTEMTKTVPAPNPPTQTTEIKPIAADIKTSKEADEGKSKAQLKAERRAKQEAQRAAKEATLQAKVVAAKPKEKDNLVSKEDCKNVTVVVKEKSPRPKAASKQGTKQQGHKVNWFRHLYNEDDKMKLEKLPVNSNLHPAIIKLGVQLATRVVSGSNARCIALLDALKKMVRDYSLPAKTEFGRGLEAYLASSLEFLWSMRQPTASQTNAIKFFRHHLTQLPNNVDEFDAKKTLQEEIDQYIREQIDKAGEAISITVRTKICKDDVILTYGCSSLIERILVEAYASNIPFRVVVVGGGPATRPAREMTRRLTGRGVPCICVDITALGFIMRTVNKVVLGASALLANGSVLGMAGTAGVALAARAANKPVLVACETHKVSERVQTDAFVYNEIGDPDDLIDKSDDNSPLKDWRSNPNLTPLNITYDVTPPNLVTAVVTELAILPCTSAPVVLRFKLSEYTV